MSIYGSQFPKMYLKPGKMFIGRKPAEVTTILGSCVSVIFFSPNHKIGAICHALLPSGKSEGDWYKYVDSSIDRMLEEFRNYGVDCREIQVKLFGGSDMFAVSNPDSLSVGRQNIQAALKIIEAQGLNLVASDVGGNACRKLVFFPHSGEVLLKRHRAYNASGSDERVLE
ncbi:MAG: chemotaxis protein CheD [Syntrophobacteraceae bacterium]|jgi:chemotaxis protein CheD